MKKQEQASLTEQAVNALRRDIILNVYPPGGKITIDSMKKSYNMGGSPVREALNQLVGEQWVQALPLRGFCVDTVTALQCNDLLEAKHLLESQLIMTSLTHRNDHWESLIIAAYYRFSKAIQPAGGGWAEKEHWVSVKQAFLMTLVMKSVSPWLFDVYQNTIAHVLRYEIYMLFHQDEGRGSVILTKEYEALVNAMTQSTADSVVEQLSVLNQAAINRANTFWSHHHESN